MEHILLLKLEENKLGSGTDDIDMGSAVEIYDFGSVLTFNIDQFKLLKENDDNAFYILTRNDLEFIIDHYQGEILNYYKNVFKDRSTEKLLKPVRDNIVFWSGQRLTEKGFYFFSTDKEKAVFRLLFILETFDFNKNKLILMK